MDRLADELDVRTPHAFGDGEAAIVIDIVTSMPFGKAPGRKPGNSINRRMARSKPGTVRAGRSRGAAMAIARDDPGKRHARVC